MENEEQQQQQQFIDYENNRIKNSADADDDEFTNQLIINDNDDDADNDDPLSDPLAIDDELNLLSSSSSSSSNNQSNNSALRIPNDDADYADANDLEDGNRRRKYLDNEKSIINKIVVIESGGGGGGGGGGDDDGINKRKSYRKEEIVFVNINHLKRDFCTIEDIPKQSIYCNDNDDDKKNIIIDNELDIDDEGDDADPDVDEKEIKNVIINDYDDVMNENITTASSDGDGDCDDDDQEFEELTTNFIKKPSSVDESPMNNLLDDKKPSLNIISNNSITQLTSVNNQVPSVVGDGLINYQQQNSTDNLLLDDCCVLRSSDNGSDSGLGSETTTTSITTLSLCNNNSNQNDDNKIPIIMKRSNLKRRSAPTLDDHLLTDDYNNNNNNNMNMMNKPKRPKRSITFNDVTVYYFPRIQGFVCVPSQGGCTLGMTSQHIDCKRFSIAEHLTERRLHRHQQTHALKSLMYSTGTGTGICNNIESNVNGNSNKLIEINASNSNSNSNDNDANIVETAVEDQPPVIVGSCSSDGGDASDSDDDDDDDDDDDEQQLSDNSSSSSELDTESTNGGFVQPITARQRRLILKSAGIRFIDCDEKDECKSIRSSREFCGCSCRDYCDPDTCFCSQSGIKCQVDRLHFPCGCTRDGCGNRTGRIEFNPNRVRTHFIHTIMRLNLEDKKLPAEKSRQNTSNVIMSNQLSIPQSSPSSSSIAIESSQSIVRNDFSNHRPASDTNLQQFHMLNSQNISEIVCKTEWNSTEMETTGNVLLPPLQNTFNYNIYHHPHHPHPHSHMDYSKNHSTMYESSLQSTPALPSSSLSSSTSTSTSTSSTIHSSFSQHNNLNIYELDLMRLHPIDNLSSSSSSITTKATTTTSPHYDFTDVLMNEPSSSSSLSSSSTTAGTTAAKLSSSPSDLLIEQSNDIRLTANPHHHHNQHNHHNEMYSSIYNLSQDDVEHDLENYNQITQSLLIKTNYQNDIHSTSTITKTSSSSSSELSSSLSSSPGAVTVTGTEKTSQQSSNYSENDIFLNNINFNTTTTTSESESSVNYQHHNFIDDNRILPLSESLPFSDDYLSSGDLLNDENHGDNEDNVMENCQRLINDEDNKKTTATECPSIIKENDDCNEFVNLHPPEANSDHMNAINNLLEINRNNVTLLSSSTTMETTETKATTMAITKPLSIREQENLNKNVVVVVVDDKNNNNLINNEDEIEKQFNGIVGKKESTNLIDNELITKPTTTPLITEIPNNKLNYDITTIENNSESLTSSSSSSNPVDVLSNDDVDDDDKKTIVDNSLATNTATATTNSSSSSSSVTTDIIDESLSEIIKNSIVVESVLA